MPSNRKRKPRRRTSQISISSSEFTSSVDTVSTLTDFDEAWPVEEVRRRTEEKRERILDEKRAERRRRKKIPKKYFAYKAPEEDADDVDAHLLAVAGNVSPGQASLQLGCSRRGSTASSVLGQHSEHHRQLSPSDGLDSVHRGDRDDEEETKENNAGGLVLPSVGFLTAGSLAAAPVKLTPRQSAVHKSPFVQPLDPNAASSGPESWHHPATFTSLDDVMLKQSSSSKNPTSPPAVADPACTTGEAATSRSDDSPRKKRHSISPIFEHDDEAEDAELHERHHHHHHYEHGHDEHAIPRQQFVGGVDRVWTACLRHVPPRTASRVWHSSQLIRAMLRTVMIRAATLCATRARSGRSTTPASRSSPSGDAFDPLSSSEMRLPATFFSVEDAEHLLSEVVMSAVVSASREQFEVHPLKKFVFRRGKGVYAVDQQRNRQLFLFSQKHEYHKRRLSSFAHEEEEEDEGAVGDHRGLDTGQGQQSDEPALANTLSATMVPTSVVLQSQKRFFPRACTSPTKDRVVRRALLEKERVENARTRKIVAALDRRDATQNEKKKVKVSESNAAASASVEHNKNAEASTATAHGARDSTTSAEGEAELVSGEEPWEGYVRLGTQLLVANNEIKQKYSESSNSGPPRHHRRSLVLGAVESPAAFEAAMLRQRREELGEQEVVSYAAVVAVVVQVVEFLSLTSDKLFESSGETISKTKNDKEVKEGPKESSPRSPSKKIVSKPAAALKSASGGTFGEALHERVADFAARTAPNTISSNTGGPDSNQEEGRARVMPVYFKKMKKSSGDPPASVDAEEDRGETDDDDDDNASGLSKAELHQLQLVSHHERLLVDFLRGMKKALEEELVAVHNHNKHHQQVVEEHSSAAPFWHDEAEDLLGSVGCFDFPSFAELSLLAASAQVEQCAVSFRRFESGRVQLWEGVDPFWTITGQQPPPAALAKKKISNKRKQQDGADVPDGDIDDAEDDDDEEDLGGFGARGGPDQAARRGPITVAAASLMPAELVYYYLTDAGLKVPCHAETKPPPFLNIDFVQALPGDVIIDVEKDDDGKVLDTAVPKQRRTEDPSVKIKKKHNLTPAEKAERRMTRAMAAGGDVAGATAAANKANNVPLSSDSRTSPKKTTTPSKKKTIGGGSPVDFIALDVLAASHEEAVVASLEEVWARHRKRSDFSFLGVPQETLDGVIAKPAAAVSSASVASAPQLPSAVPLLPKPHSPLQITEHKFPATGGPPQQQQDHQRPMTTTSELSHIRFALTSAAGGGTADSTSLGRRRSPPSQQDEQQQQQRPLLGSQGSEVIEVGAENVPAWVMKAMNGKVAEEEDKARRRLLLSPFSPRDDHTRNVLELQQQQSVATDHSPSRSPPGGTSKNIHPPWMPTSNLCASSHGGGGSLRAGNVVTAANLLGGAEATPADHYEQGQREVYRARQEDLTRRLLVSTDNHGTRSSYSPVSPPTTKLLQNQRKDTSVFGGVSGGANAASWEVVPTASLPGAADVDVGEDAQLGNTVAPYTTPGGGDVGEGAQQLQMMFSNAAFDGDADVVCRDEQLYDGPAPEKVSEEAAGQSPQGTEAEVAAELKKKTKKEKIQHHPQQLTIQNLSFFDEQTEQAREQKEELRMERRKQRDRDEEQNGDPADHHGHHHRRHGEHVPGTRRMSRPAPLIFEDERPAWHPQQTAAVVVPGMLVTVPTIAVDQPPHGEQDASIVVERAVQEQEDPDEEGGGGGHPGSPLLFRIGVLSSPGTGRDAAATGGRAMMGSPAVLSSHQQLSSTGGDIGGGEDLMTAGTMLPPARATSGSAAVSNTLLGGSTTANQQQRQQVHSANSFVGVVSNVAAVGEDQQPPAEVEDDEQGVASAVDAAADLGTTTADAIITTAHDDRDDSDVDDDDDDSRDSVERWVDNVSFHQRQKEEMSKAAAAEAADADTDEDDSFALKSLEVSRTDGPVRTTTMAAQHDGPPATGAAGGGTGSFDAAEGSHPNLRSVSDPDIDVFQHQQQQKSQEEGNATNTNTTASNPTGGDEDRSRMGRGYEAEEEEQEEELDDDGDTPPHHQRLGSSSSSATAVGGQDDPNVVLPQQSSPGSSSKQRQPVPMSRKAIADALEAARRQEEEQYWNARRRVVLPIARDRMMGGPSPTNGSSGHTATKRGSNKLLPVSTASTHASKKRASTSLEKRITNVAHHGPDDGQLWRPAQRPHSVVAQSRPLSRMEAAREQIANTSTTAALRKAGVLQASVDDGRDSKRVSSLIEKARGPAQTASLQLSSVLAATLMSAKKTFAMNTRASKDTRQSGALSTPMQMLRKRNSERDSWERQQHAQMRLLLLQQHDSRLLQQQKQKEMAIIERLESPPKSEWNSETIQRSSLIKVPKPDAVSQLIEKKMKQFKKSGSSNAGGGSNSRIHSEKQFNHYDRDRLRHKVALTDLVSPGAGGGGGFGSGGRDGGLGSLVQVGHRPGTGGGFYVNSRPTSQ